MRFLLRPRNLYVLLSYCVLSCMPFVPRLFGLPVAHPGQLAGIALVCWIGAWAVFKRPACFHWLLLPAFLALPMELYLYAFYGQGISTHHLGIVFETSPAEALEFLGSKVWLMIAVFAGMLAWFITSWIAAWRTRDLDWDDLSRWVVLGVLAYFTTMGYWRWWVGRQWRRRQCRCALTRSSGTHAAAADQQAHAQQVEQRGGHQHEADRRADADVRHP